MKVDAKAKEKIIKIYAKHRAIFPREISLKKTAAETGFGRTTIFDHTEELERPLASKPKTDVSKYKYKDTPATYIISAWELRVATDKKFIQTLKQMAAFYNAELLLVPLTEADANYIPEELDGLFTIITDNVVFNSNLELKFVETNALVQSPLSGHIGAYSTSVIIPGLVRELRTEPSQHYAKQTMSTGSVGPLGSRLRDYAEAGEDADLLKRLRAIRTRRNGRPTAIAENYVVPSALIVDIVDNKTFLTRYISSVRNGVVYDLDKKFTPDGVEAYQPSALIVGDVHVAQIDEEAWQATKEMIARFDPKEVVIQDVFDGLSINHHEINDPVASHVAPSIREEADETIAFLEELTPLTNKVTYLESNHDEFLRTFLKMNTMMWRLNRNYAVACGLQMFQLETGKNPIIKLLEFNRFPNLLYVTAKDNYYISGVLVKHGHHGANGARSGFTAMAKIYNRYVCGHLHSPAIFRNAMCVGLIAKLDMGYNVGASAWLHSNGLIHADGSQQLLNIIKGKWSL